MALDRFSDIQGGGRGGYPQRRPYGQGGGMGAPGGGGGIIERIPPQNIEAEKAVLGAMLLDKPAIEKAGEALQRDDFYREAHAHIYDAMLSLAEQDEPVDIVTLKDELTRKGILDGVGGLAYLMELADFVPSSANVVYYATIVREKAVLRRLIEAASEIAGLAYGDVEEVDRLVDAAERTIFEVGARRQGKAFAPLRPLLNEAFEKIDTLYHEKGVVTGVDTGFSDLNYITSGLQPGDLFILAARPSMGKCLTAWSLLDDPVTGERLTIEECVRRQSPLALGVGECGRVRPARISAWIDSGVKPCWKVTTRSGRFVEVTGHHPFLSVHGWTPLHDLKVGDKIGVPRTLPVFGSDDSLPLDQVGTLACATKDAQEAFPACIWTWPKAHLASFLRALMSGDGTFIATAEALARDVHHALVRFGVVADLRSQSDRCWQVEIADAESVDIYQREISGIVKPVRNTEERKAWLPADVEALDEDQRLRLASPDLYWDEIVGIESIGEHQVYDLTVPDGANFIAQDICVHNTSLAVAIGQNAALNTGASIAVFSLEMGANQLVQRMICSEARVDGNKLRTGFLHDDDWERLAAAVNRLWDANIYIDDSTEITAMEMRAKCRRLKAEQGALDLIIVDYLQLMRSSSKNAGNRNEEITEISRGLKNLAREMKCPVIALAQLSRAVERREDKRPMLSDLRDCLTGDARLYCAETGRLVPIAEVTPGMQILAVGEDQRVRPATISQVWDKGVQSIYRVTTETGRVLECTANHPFLTQDGYKALEKLAPGDLLATSMRLPEYGEERPERADLCRFLGYMVGDGSYGKWRTPSFISADRDTYEDAKSIVAAHFPAIHFHEDTVTRKQTCWDVDFVCHHGGDRFGKPFGNPLLNWLRDEVGILGQLCQDKRVPNWVFEAGSVGAREFLRGYLATDGCVKVQRGTGKWDVHFDTVSHGLAGDVQHLLLRLGVVATVQKAQRKDMPGARPIYRVGVNPQSDNLRRFASLVQPVGRKGRLLDELLAAPERVATNPGVFSLPPHVSRLMAERTAHLRQQGRKLPEDVIGRLYWKDQGKRPRRDICGTWAAKLDDAELATWATSDLLWERVRSVEPVGEKQTYDICVPETGNFLAEGCVVHNSGSIEAEADVVAFIYRPAYYERKEVMSQEAQEEADEQRRPGEYDTEESEVIIAKQRNGPTGTVKLAFMPRFARFDNLAEYREESPF